MATSTCKYCDRDITHEPGVGWVDELSGDDGGTYDVCDVRGGTKPHVPEPINATPIVNPFQFQPKES